MKTVKILFALTALALTSCTPSAKSLKEAIEKDPSIVFVAIEKDPDKFMEVVQESAKKAQASRQEKMAKDEAAKQDEEFKNPLKPEIQEGRAILGKADAPITIVEFSDFECPYCSRGYATINEVKKEYGDKVRFVFKHFPLDGHPNAMPAAKYFEAVARQSSEKAYKFHDIIFENQGNLRAKGEAFLKEAAKKAGADLAKLQKDLADEKLMDRINADLEEARKFDITGTPAFIINGVSLRGAFPYPAFKKVIDRHLEGK